MSLPDYYAILEVSSSATFEQIKQAYRRLARQFHPDVNRQVEDSYIKQLNEAYTILSDMAKRTNYDIQRLETLQREIMLDLIMRQQHQAQPRMTWAQGMAGFMQELKKGLRETP